MIYCVVCTDLNAYVDWQFELLEYSWHRAGQSGELLRLVTCGNDVALPKQVHARVERIEATPVRYLGYKAFERLFALEEWLRRERPVGTVLVVDPDVVFVRALADGARAGSPRAQHWVDYVPASGQAQAATWPMLIHTSDLELLLPHWIAHTAAIYGATRRWESDMHALVSAAATLGLKFSLEAVGAFVGWPEEMVGDAPIVHYCQDVLDVKGRVLWSKRGYRPWERVKDADRAAHGYCREMLKVVDEYAASRASGD